MGEWVEEQGGCRGKHCGQEEHEKEQDDGEVGRMVRTRQKKIKEEEERG